MADAALPPDPGKLLQVDAPYVDTAGPAGLIEDAKRGLAGAGDDFFAKQQAENSLAYANNRFSDAVFGQHRRDEQTAYVEKRNQEIRGQDANHNGKSDFDEIKAAEDRRAMGLCVSGGPLALSYGAMQLLGPGPRGMFTALSYPPFATRWTLGMARPMEAFTLIAAAHLGHTFDPQMPSPPIFASRAADMTLQMGQTADPSLAANDPHYTMGRETTVTAPASLSPSSPAVTTIPEAAAAPAANDPSFTTASEETGSGPTVATPRVSSPRRPAPAMDLVPRPKPPTWATSGSSSRGSQG